MARHFTPWEGQQAMSFDASRYAVGKFLHGSDIPAGQTLTLTIREAFEHQFDDGSKRPALRFLEIEQIMTLNKSQVVAMIQAFGPNAGAWVSQRIELMSVPSNFQGKPTILIRAATAPSMPTFNGAQLGQPPAAAPQPAPAMIYVEPTMGGAQGDDARRLWESQQQAPTMPTAAGVTFR